MPFRSESISSTSVRYFSEDIQFSRMNNAILPQVSSQLYSFGYNDIITDIPVQIDSRSFGNTYYDSSPYVDSNIFAQHEQLDGISAIYSQSPINYQSVPSSNMTIKRLEVDSPSFGGSYITTNKSAMPAYDNTKQQQPTRVESLSGQLIQNAIRSSARKRPNENGEVIQRSSPDNLVGNKSSQSEWTTNKKMAVCFQEQLQDHQQLPKETKEVQREKVPVRRSQKLADRITSLQKLVSPYGKTDTASVLQEASIFIKVLQDQIENMVRVLNTPLDNQSPQAKISGEKQFDLQSKGLCLVPVSLTQKLVKEDAFNQYSNTMFISPMPQDTTLTIV